MSENNQVILDTSQAKVALAELEARLKSLDKAMDGVSAGALIAEYKKLSAGASEMATAISKLEAAKGTSVRSMQRYRETLASTLTTIGQLKSGTTALSTALTNQGKATDNSKAAMVSYRAVISGLSYSFREAGKYSQDYVKGLAVQKAAAAEQNDMLAGMYKMRDSFQKLGRMQSIAEQMDMRRTTALQKAAAAEQNDMLTGMYKMKESFQKLGRQWSLAEQMDLRRTTALQKAAAAEQNDMLAGMYKMKESFQKLGRMQSIAEQMDLRRTTALQKAAAAEQNDMLAGMYKMRDSYRATEQKRDVELNNIRQAQAVRYRAINEKRDLEEYTMRQAHLKRMEMLERRWLEAGPRGQASQAMKARSLMDAGMDPSKYYSAQAIAAARSLKETDNLTTALSKMGKEYRAGGGHALAFTESQHAAHAALRGVSGALGMLWITYGKYIAVMAAATAATMAFKRTFEQGLEFDYQTRFAASLGDSVESVDELQAALKDGLLSASKEAYGSAVELAGGLRIMQQAGYDSALAIKSIGVVAQAALVGEADMKTAAEDLVAVLEIFGMHSEDPDILASNFKYAGDVMAWVAKETRANLRDVASSFQNVIGVSEAYGVKIETVAALTEKLGKAGIVAGRAGTFIRNFFDNALGAPTEKAKGILDSIGMKLFDFSKDDPVQWMDKLKKKVQEFDAVSQTAIENGLFTDRGVKVWRAYVAEAESLAEATARIGRESAGSLQEVSDNVRKAVKVEFKEAFDALDDSLTRAFSNAEDGTSKLANRLKEVFSDPALEAVISKITEMLANLALEAINLVSGLKSLSDYELPPHIKAGLTIMNKGQEFFSDLFKKDEVVPTTREARGLVRYPDLIRGGSTPAENMTKTPSVDLIKSALGNKPRVVGDRKWEPPKPGGNGGRGRVDRTPMKEVDSASKLANAEYEQALASIEFYKKGLDLRKNARMVGEKEYQDTLDALAELEIQKGIDREDAVQKAISESLPRVKDSAMREDLMGRMAESLQKEQELTTKAYTDKALAQLKAQISQKEFLREIERVESESFSNRLSAQEQFVKEWNAKNGELLQRAMVDGDMESFIRLKNAEGEGREVARRSDATELAGMFPDNNEAQMAALEARYLAERERMLALTKENLDLQHQLEMDLTSRYQMELAQLRLQGVYSFMSAGEQMTSAVAGLIGAVVGEQSEAYRVMFAASKAFAVAKATMDMYTAVSAAMAVQGPLGWAQIGPIMASMSSLIGQISSINYSGAYDKGGIIPSGKWGIVGEYGPEIVQGPANVTSREKTAELLRGSGRSEAAAPAAPPTLNARIVNVLDPKLVGDFLGTDDGEKLIMNVIQRNKTALTA